MATIVSSLPIAYQQALTRTADVNYEGVDLFNLATAIDATLSNSTLSETGLTAHAGGGQTNALALNPVDFVHVVTTVATTADSVRLPVSVKGQAHKVINAGANSMQVFGAGTDTINAVATGTGVAIAAGAGTEYFCYAAGTWVSI